MNILSITAQKPHSTGSGTYLTELVRSWDRAGHRQAVVCGIYPQDSVDFPEGVGCYPVFFTDTAAGPSAASADTLFCSCKTAKQGIRALPFPITGMSDIMPYTSTRYRDLTPSMISQFEEAFIEAIGRAVSDLDPDLIVCHHLFLLTSLVRKHFPDRKIYGISHGTDLRQMVNCDNLRDLVRPEIAQLDQALALHADQEQRIREIFGMDEARVRVIGSGYNAGLFNTEGRMTRQELQTLSGEDHVPVMICYAGKISRPKGVPELLRVFSMLNEDPEIPAFEVILAGGCQDDAVRDKLDHLPSNVQWVGQIPQTRLAEIFRFNDIFVLPSYFEGLPLVLIEAMASGMIPVSTDLPGVRDWISANVPDHNICFVPMPEMETIVQPTAAGRESFTAALYSSLKDMIIAVSSGRLPDHQPDTGSITWDAVAARVIG